MHVSMERFESPSPAIFIICLYTLLRIVRLMSVEWKLRAESGGGCWAVLPISREAVRSLSVF